MFSDFLSTEARQFSSYLIISTLVHQVRQNLLTSMFTLWFTIFTLYCDWWITARWKTSLYFSAKPAGSLRGYFSLGAMTFIMFYCFFFVQQILTFTTRLPTGLTSGSFGRLANVRRRFRIDVCFLFNVIVVFSSTYFRFRLVKPSSCHLRGQISLGPLKKSRFGAGTI